MSDSQMSCSDYQWEESAASDLTLSRESLRRYAASSVEYYERAKDRLSGGILGGTTFNWSCALFGPHWAASRRLWALCWTIAFLDAVALVLLGRALWLAPTGIDHSLMWTAIALLVAERAACGCVANLVFFHRFSKWRSNQALGAGISLPLAAGTFLLIGSLTALLVYRFSASEVASFIEDFPTDRDIALQSARAIDELVLALTVEFGAFFDVVTATMRAILKALKTLFIGIPWPVMSTLMLLAAWRAGGFKVVVFTAGAILYLGLFGFWTDAMDTLSLVAGSVVICIVIGTPIGIWSAKSSRVNTVVTPVLDLMQTMPSFVYLIPAIAFFSVGRTPAVIATVVFAMPPMIRLTALGISQVPAHVKESALAFGATPAQLLFKVELPLSLPSLMAGVNQTVMMSLSMVVIAALIGAGGLGFKVLFALQQVDAGQGLLSGIAIVVCAMVVDRIIQGSRMRQGASEARTLGKSN
jgi:glycine betaine/proline transport system permease protein